MDINELLKKANSLEASDLHIKVGCPPILRIYGELTPMIPKPLQRRAVRIARTRALPNVPDAVR